MCRVFERKKEIKRSFKEVFKVHLDDWITGLLDESNLSAVDSGQARMTASLISRSLWA